MPVMKAIDANDPLMIAWNSFKATNSFAIARNQAKHNEGVDGALWASFVEGFRTATDRARNLHESVNPASDDERLHKVPGAGAMGAVIEYRDLIRAPDHA